MQDIRQKLAEVFQVVFDLSPDVDPILVSQKSLGCLGFSWACHACYCYGERVRD